MEFDVFLKEISGFSKKKRVPGGDMYIMRSGNPSLHPHGKFWSSNHLGSKCFVSSKNVFEVHDVPSTRMFCCKIESGERFFEKMCSRCADTAHQNLDPCPLRVVKGERLV